MRPGHSTLKLIHRWVGLATGLLLALLGVTGSLLVFHRELDHFVLNRDLWRDETIAASQLTLSELAETVRQQRPQGTGHGADRPAFQGSRPLGYWEERGPGGTSRYMTAALDPATGRIVGAFAWGELPITRPNFTSVVYRLHYELFAGATGTVVVGIVGFAAILLVIIGLYLWWPPPGRWRQRLTLKAGAAPVRRDYDLHNLVGAVSAVVLFVVSLSGAYMCFPDQFRAVIGQVAPVTHEPPAVAVGPLRSGAASEAERRAQQLLSDARYDSVGLPQAGLPIRLVFREPGDPRQQLGSTRIDADPTTGELLRIRRPSDDSPADLLMRWQFPLHNGEALGLPGRLLVFAAGLTPAILLWTGAGLWLARRRARRRVAIRRGR